MPKKKRVQKPALQRKVKFNKKRRASSNRDYNNPEYSKWRKEVKERDNNQCQWPGCGSHKRLQVHHIKTWAKYPALRFTTANGITLCRKCHDYIKGKEHDYEFFFLKILEWKMIDKIKAFDKSRGKR